MTLDDRAGIFYYTHAHTHTHTHMNSLFRTHTAADMTDDDRGAIFGPYRDCVSITHLPPPIHQTVTGIETTTHERRDKRTNEDRNTEAQIGGGQRRGAERRGAKRRGLERRREQDRMLSRHTRAQMTRHTLVVHITRRTHAHMARQTLVCLSYGLGDIDPHL